jgi:hypothetical protein
VRATPIRALFIGSSITQAHFMPGIIGALARKAGRAPLAYRWVIRGGTTLERLYDKGRGTPAVDAIHSQHWDWLFLQERNVELLQAPERAAVSARRFFDETGSPRPRLGYYQKYAFRDAAQTHEALVRAAAGATPAGATVVPVGQAWQRVRTDRPDIQLFQDTEHPTPVGAFLAACVFYIAIYNDSPVGLPADLEAMNPDGGLGEAIHVPEKDARYLQEVAWSTRGP